MRGTVERQIAVDLRRVVRMGEIDSLPADTRSLVNDYGWHVVNTCISLGVCKPKQIKHLVETVLDEFSPTRGSHSSQGRRGTPSPASS